MNQTKPDLRSLFCDALEVADAAERSAFLDQACGADTELRRRVEALLTAESSAGRFLTGTPARPNLEPARPGERVGRYRIVERIGQGGYGIVYRAQQEDPVRREVALKILKLGIDTRAVVTRFELERQALALMDHPNIARVFDAGATESGRPYFVMELVQGKPITDYCRLHSLPLRRRLELFIQICQAVQHAHQKGVIHRDLKPSNILVVEIDGAPTPKVIDFGIAKAAENTMGTAVTAAHEFVGTPAYMSPEQVAAGRRDVDTRCDIYGLGMVLYELIAGRPPFDPKVLQTAGFEEVCRIIRDVDPPRPSTTVAAGKPATPRNGEDPRRELAALRNDVDWIVLKCLEKDRDRRYETASDLAADLRRHLDHEPVKARPPSVWYRVRKVARRHRLSILAASATFAALLAGAIVSTGLAVRASRAERVAQAEAVESEERLLRRYVAEANRLLEQNRPHASLPLQVEAIARERSAPRQAEGRLRLALALDRAPPLQLHITHGREVPCVALSPDGQWLASGSDDGTVRVSKVDSGGTTATNLWLGGFVGALTISPDGALLAAANRDGWARVWELATGRALTDAMRPDDFRAERLRSLGIKLAPTVRFSPDSRRLLLAWGSRTAQWREATTGALLREFDHGGHVWHAALSKSGRYAATSGDDGTVRIWDTETGQPAGAVLQHRGMVAWSDFSADETHLLTVRERRHVQVWDWRSGQKVGPEISTGSVFFSARFSPKGRRFLTSIWGGTARLHEPGTGRVVEEFQHDGGLVDAVFSPDGNRIAVACHDGNTWVWRVDQSRRPEAVLPIGDTADRVVFSADGRRLAAGARNGRARVWHLKGPEKRLRSFPARDGRFVAWSGAAHQFLIAGGTRSTDVRFYDAATGHPAGRADFPDSPAGAARYSPDGTRVLVVAGTKTHVLETTHHTEGLPPLAHGSAVLDAHWLSDGRSIITASRADGLRLWDAASGEVKAQSAADDGLSAVAVSPNGSIAATAHTNGFIRRWAVTGTLAASEAWTVPYPVTRLRFTPDGTRLGVAGALENDDSILEIRDIPGGRLAARIPSRNTLNDFEFSPDGQRVVLASEDRTARVWATGTGQPLSPAMVHGYAVERAYFSPDGRWLATLGSRGFVRLWNSQTGEPLTTFFDFNRDSGGYHGQFSPDGRHFLFTTGAQVGWRLELVPDGGSLRELQVLAKALACHAVEPDGSLTPLDNESLQSAWLELQSLRSSAP